VVAHGARRVSPAEWIAKETEEEEEGNDDDGGQRGVLLAARSPSPRAVRFTARGLASPLYQPNGVGETYTPLNAAVRPRAAHPA
jgi:hypothetical protein